MAKSQQQKYIKQRKNDGEPVDGTGYCCVWLRNAGQHVTVISQVASTWRTCFVSFLTAIEP